MSLDILKGHVCLPVKRQLGLALVALSNHFWVR